MSILPAGVLLTEHAPAKINLSLHVTGQRPDGFHELDSLVVFAAPGDQVELRASDADAFVVDGKFAPDISGAAENLVIKARDAFFSAASMVSPVHLALTKQLPVASGIGGGSADAAATLNLLARAHVDKQIDLHAVAARLGSDVPMCLCSRPKHVQGVGDQFHIVDHMPPFWLVLANPRVSVSTPQVFQRLKNRSNPAMPQISEGWSSLDALVDYLAETRNDLRAAAVELVPEIKTLEEDMQSLPRCRFARMSGSGATVFGIFATQADAEAGAVALKKNNANYWVQASEVLRTRKPS